MTVRTQLTAFIQYPIKSSKAFSLFQKYSGNFEIGMEIDNFGRAGGLSQLPPNFNFCGRTENLDEINKI
jgi:hypothetical protein